MMFSPPHADCHCLIMFYITVFIETSSEKVPMIFHSVALVLLFFTRKEGAALQDQYLLCVFTFVDVTFCPVVIYVIYETDVWRLKVTKL